MYYPMFYDPTYILVMIGVVICLLASAKMNSTFSKIFPRAQPLGNDRKRSGRSASSQRRYL